MSSDTVRQAFLDQAGSCEALGSPFTARLCRLLAERLEPDNAVATHILDWPGNPSPSADSVPLRMAGCMHALVLERRDGLLSVAYPPDEVDDDALWIAISRAFQTHAEFIVERMQSAPQTNEVRRSAALLPGFLTLGQMFGKPLVLSEVGASAGLNLQWDRYRYRLGESTWGNPLSPVAIEPIWRGEAPPLADLMVAGRAGCDLKPVDPANRDHRLRMLSYIWADQSDRMARTRAALDLGAQHQIRISRSDAIDWLRMRLGTPHKGALHVIFNTIAWQYLPKASQDEGARLVSDAGAGATVDAPLAHLQLEADGDREGASLSLQVWPSGEKQEIGRADFHGRWVEWKGWQA